jgi:predicted lipoprotein with Yx(FWY)xxD motif
MRRSNLRYALVAALAAFAFAACSSSSKVSSTTTPTTTGSVTSTTTAYATPTTAGSTTTTSGTSVTTHKTVATVSIETTKLGKVLADSKGLTLYVWDSDKAAGKSSCTGTCATIWPPVTATGTPTYGAGVAASMFSVITRADGTKQLAVNGKPLYTFASDKKSKDVTGQGVGGFHAVRPNGKKY